MSFPYGLPMDPALMGAWANPWGTFDHEVDDDAPTPPAPPATAQPAPVAQRYETFSPEDARLLLEADIVARGEVAEDG